MVRAGPRIVRDLERLVAHESDSAVEWRYRHTVLVLAVFGNFTQLGARIVVSPVVPQIIDAFDTSKSVIGLVLTVMWGIYALTQFPSGLLGDRYGERAIMLVSFGMIAVASVLLALAPSLFLFGAIAALLGIGAGLYFSVASSLLSKLFENQGQALGFHTAGGAIAGLFVPVIVAHLSLRYGWRVAILLGAVFAIPIAVLVAWRVRSTPPNRPDESPLGRVDLSLLSLILSRPPLVYTILLAVIGVFAFQAFSSFFPTFLIEYRGLSTGQASLAFGVVFLLSAVSQPTMGHVSDMVDRDSAIAASMIIGIVGFTLLLLTSDLVGIVVGVGVLGIGMSWAGVIQARFMDHLPEDVRNTGFGLVRTVYMVIGAFGSVITGTLADVAGWLVAFGVVAGFLLIGVGALLANRVFKLGL